MFLHCVLLLRFRNWPQIICCRWFAQYYMRLCCPCSIYSKGTVQVFTNVSKNVTIDESIKLMSDQELQGWSYFGKANVTSFLDGLLGKTNALIVCWIFWPPYHKGLLLSICMYLVCLLFHVFLRRSKTETKHNQIYANY